MYVDIMLNNLIVHAMVDTSSSHNFLSDGELRNFHLTTVQGSGSSVKAINSVAKCTHAVLMIVVQMGNWSSVCELVVMPLDDFLFILGLDFMWKAKIAIMPHHGGLMIFDDRTSCFVHVSQDREETMVLTTLQVRDGPRCGEVMYVATMCEVIPQHVHHEALPTKVAELLDKFWDVMLEELPSELPPQRDMDHCFKLMPSSMLSMQALYRTPLVYLEELKK